jgi:hypothetical protein
MNNYNTSTCYTNYQCYFLTIPTISGCPWLSRLYLHRSWEIAFNQFNQVGKGQIK